MNPDSPVPVVRRLWGVCLLCALVCLGARAELATGVIERLSAPVSAGTPVDFRTPALDTAGGRYFVPGFGAGNILAAALGWNATDQKLEWVTSFGGTGLKIVGRPTGFNHAAGLTSVFLQSPSPRMIIGGWVIRYAPYVVHPVLACVDAAGTLCPGFGDGTGFFVLTGVRGTLTQLAVVGDGADAKILLTGNTYATDQEIFVAKVTSAGQLDTSFAVSGIRAWRDPAVHQHSRPVFVSPSPIAAGASIDILFTHGIDTAVHGEGSDAPVPDDPGFTPFLLTLDASGNVTRSAAVAIPLPAGFSGAVVSATAAGPAGTAVVAGHFLRASDLSRSVVFVSRLDIATGKIVPETAEGVASPPGLPDSFGSGALTLASGDILAGGGVGPIPSLFRLTLPGGAGAIESLSGVEGPSSHASPLVTSLTPFTDAQSRSLVLGTTSSGVAFVYAPEPAGTPLPTPTPEPTSSATPTVTARLDVSRSGNGIGTVHSAPAGIACGTACGFDFPLGTGVTLTATPGSDSRFVGWSGDGCSGSDTTCTVTVDNALGVTAEFASTRVFLSVTRSGPGSGTVTGGGLSCGSHCEVELTEGDSVLLLAEPDPGSTFEGFFGGGCSGPGPCTVTMDAAQSVSAVFGKPPRTLTLAKTGAGKGTIYYSDAQGLYYSCDETCTGVTLAGFPHGSIVSFAAEADGQSTFQGWTAPCGANPNCGFVISADMTMTVRFETQTAVLAVSRDGAGSGTVASDPAGIDCGTDCNEALAKGTLVTLTATPDADSVFSGWSGGCSGTGACQLTLSAARTVTAAFAVRERSLGVTIAGGGHVSGGDIDCPGTCSVNVPQGQAVSLVASASAGYRFAGWSGACTATAGDCALTMTSDQQVTATFDRDVHALTVSLSGDGTGSVATSPAGVTCPGTCQADFESGAPVTLTAAPQAASRFTGWSGDCSGTSTTCTVSVDGAKSVTATFEKNTIVLTASVEGDGTGTVTSDPPGIMCPGGCAATVAQETVVTLTATPAPHSIFAGWSGGCSGTIATCTITLSAARSVVATFAKAQYRLDVGITGGAGRVTSAPFGIDCRTSSCSQLFDAGTPIALTPIPDAGYRFAGWDGACPGTASCSITLTGAASVTASFEPVPYQLTVEIPQPARGSVTGNGTSCTQTSCTATIPGHDPVTLTATARAGYRFSHWESACEGSTSESCSFTMMADSTARAVFVPRTFTLLLQAGGASQGGTVSAGSSTCPGDCAVTVSYGETLIVTASAASDSAFTSWAGDCAGTVSLCTLTIDEARDYTATGNFRRNLLAVSLAVDGTGTGSIAGSPGTLSCPGTCVESFDQGSTVTLTATASTGSTFTGWSGACAGQSGPCVLSVDGTKSVAATFTKTTHPVTIALSDPAMGNVSGSLACSQASCTQSFDWGTSLSLHPAPATGHELVGWGGDCAGTGDCTLTVDGTKSVEVTFKKRSFDLTVSVVGTGSITGGSIDCPGAACSASLPYQTAITLTASPGTGFDFAGWAGACSGTGTCQVTIEDARSVTATFTRGTFALGVAKSGNGEGSVTSVPAGIDCGAVCAGSFAYQTSITLTAIAEAGSRFAGWKGCGSTTADTCTVSLEASTVVTATFEKIPRTLTVSHAGTGGGRITGGTIDCGTACSATAPHGTATPLVALADDESVFTGWSGACTGTAACTVILDADRAVTATFARQSRLLVVGLTGTGGGSVSSDPPGIDCPSGECAHPFDSGTVVTLAATPDATSTFDGWGAPCVVTGDGRCQVTLSQAVTVTASFTRRRHSLTVARAGNGDGSVSGFPGLLSCPGACSDTYDEGLQVRLTATASGNSLFTGWGSPCSGTSDCVVTMTQARTVTATFALRQYPLVVKVSDAAGVRVTGGPGIDCGAACTGTFDAGSQVTVSASVTDGYAFDGWLGPCADPTSRNCTVTMGAAGLEVTAVVHRMTYPLTVQRQGNGGGTVSGSPGGVNCGTTCSESLGHGESVSLLATADSGSRFTGWSGDCSGDTSCVVAMTGSRHVTATFTRIQYALDVTVTGGGAGYVTSDPTGIDCRSGTCSSLFDRGTIVTLGPTADAGSRFAGWTGACSGTGACAVPLFAARSVGASFVPATRKLTVTLRDAASGSVSGNGLACTSPICTTDIVEGTAVKLTAAENAGFRFTGWEGPCASPQSPLCELTMGSTDVELTAVFAPRTYTLTLTAGSGGTVATAKGTCPGACTQTFSHGETATLTATADATYAITGWSGACAGNTPSCTLTLTQDVAAGATFRKLTHPVTLAVDGTGEGAISGSTGDLGCPGPCGGTIEEGSTIALTAAASPGSTFTTWAGACAGKPNPCAITVDGAKSVTATFARTTLPLTVTLADPAAGTVSGSIACSAPFCTKIFAWGTPVILHAAPAAGYELAGWGGDCAGAGTGDCTLVMTDARAISASFRLLPVTPPPPLPRTLTVSRAGSGVGTVTGGAIACGATCSVTRPEGTAITLDAVAEPGSTFAGWSGACVGTGACNATLDADLSVTATFVKVRRTLTIALSGDGTGRITSAPSGISCPSGCATDFDEDTLVTLAAIPDASSTFDGWPAACRMVGTSCEIRLSQSQTIAVAFTRKRYQLTIAVTPVGSGAISAPPLTCTAPCTESLAHGTTATLSATPATGFQFDGWSDTAAGGCAGTAGCSATLDSSDRTIAARFSRRSHVLEIALNGSGGGKIESALPLSCATNCAQPVTHGTAIALTAIPDDDSVFTGWTDACAGDQACSLVMDAAKRVTATFTKKMRTLTVALDLAGNAGGRVTSAPSGIDCPGACAGDYAQGSAVRLTAAADATSVFSGWSGACAGTGPCDVTLSQAQTVTATFVRRTYRLTVARAGNGGGNVSGISAGIQCDPTCSATVEAGEPVELSAGADSGSEFTGWDACPGQGSCLVTLSRDTTITATFTRVTHPLIVVKDGAGAATGVVLAPGATLACGNVCTERFEAGTVVRLVAQDGAGARFEGWSGACTGQGPCDVTMSGAQTVGATFSVMPSVPWEGVTPGPTPTGVPVAGTTPPTPAGSAVVTTPPPTSVVTTPPTPASVVTTPPAPRNVVASPPAPPAPIGSIGTSPGSGVTGGNSPPPSPGGSVNPVTGGGSSPQSIGSVGGGFSSGYTGGGYTQPYEPDPVYYGDPPPPRSWNGTDPPPPPANGKPKTSTRTVSPDPLPRTRVTSRPKTSTRLPSCEDLQSALPLEPYQVVSQSTGAYSPSDPASLSGDSSLWNSD